MTIDYELRTTDGMWIGEGRDFQQLVEDRRRHLERVQLGGRCLSGFRLKGAFLLESELHSSLLVGTDLRYAVLHRADCRRASFDSALLEGASFKGADLRGACFRNVSIEGTNFRGADLRGAMLPNNQVWESWMRETVPQLLTVGGRKLEEAANEETWSCHSWDNCPLHVAFDANSLIQVPLLYQSEALLFLKLFDQQQVPLEGVLGR